jgi:hypothetical protein
MSRRPFIGLSPGEKHPAEFRTSPIPDEPHVTVGLVVAAATSRSLCSSEAGRSINRRRSAGSYTTACVRTVPRRETGTHADLRTCMGSPRFRWACGSPSQRWQRRS